ncbi:MAG: hypothetical protein H0W86_10495, partial [Armatimonadetes bacterium]|nr:hypothetical protein [Armatimonadota bacterium]
MINPIKRFTIPIAHMTSIMRSKTLGLSIAFAGLLAFMPGQCQDDSYDVEVFRDYQVGVFRTEAVGGTYGRDSNVVYENEYSITTSLPATRFLRFRHSWGGAVATGAQRLEFAIHGGNTSIFNSIGIQVTMSNQTGPLRILSDYATQNIGGWTYVSISKNLLGIGNGRFYQLDFINIGTQPITFWLDEIRLTRTTGSTAVINVNPSQTIRTLTDPLFGVACNVWDERFDEASTKFRMREAGIKMIAYPGGTNANVYNWQTNTEVINGAIGLVDTSTFLKVADQVDSQRIIAANYGSGTPELARDWVYYANIIKGGNVIYWTIGNENYGAWSYDTHEFRHDAITYAHFVKDCMELMKAVDPRVKIGITGTWSEFAYPQRVTVQNPVTGTWTNGWTPVLYTELRKLGVTPDFMEMHFYPTGPFAESDNFLIQSNDMWNYVLPPAQRLLREYLGPPGESVPIFMGENNGNFFLPGNQSTSIVDALYLIESWTTVNKLGGNGFTWWNLHQQAETNGNLSELLYGWRMYGDYGIMSRERPPGIAPPINERYPAFFAFKLLKLFARPGDRLVRATSDNGLLSVVASKSVLTGKVRLLICNSSRNRAIPTAITFSNYSPSASILTYRYSTVEDSANADLTLMKRVNSRSLNT